MPYTLSEDIPILVMQRIRDRFKDGATPADLIAEGFARTSVYKTSTQINVKKSPARKPRAPQAKTQPAEDRPKTVSVPQPLSPDPEIAALQKRVTMAKLGNELRSTRGATYSQGVLAVYQTLKKKGYVDSFRDFIDGAVASTVLNYEEKMGLDPRLIGWATGIIGPAPDSPEDEFHAKLQELQELATMESLMRQG